MIENYLRKLGEADFYPMGLGTASFAGVNMVGSNNYQKPTNKKINELIDNALIETRASENNKLIIDTSAQYGESELRIGNYIKNNQDKIKKIYICTKWGLKFKSDDFAVQDYSLKNLEQSLENSAKLLTKIDLYYIHTNPSVKPELLKLILNENNEIIHYLKKIKEEKKFGIKKLGLQEIFSEVLEINKNAIILTGTSSAEHLKQNFNYVKNHIENDEIKISYYTQNFIPTTISKVNENLSSYFKIFNTKNSNLQKNNNTNSSKDLVINNIIDILVGSLKTRIGPEPDEEQRKLFYNIINFFVQANMPIDTILTWGPKKFFNGKEEDHIDLSEALSFQTLMLLNNRIRSVYTPGLQIYLFIEDFEGKFIEGDYLENIFDSYIGELEKLVKILRMSKIIRIIRTQDLILINYNFEELTAQLKKNYDCLSKYWLESEKLGIDNSEKLESYKKIEKLGWFEKIGHDTRDYYIGRLNKMLGNTKTYLQKVDMTVRLLACVLVHRQYDLFKINNKSEPLKLSFLKISGGPKKLMNGRIDVRTIPTNISKGHISPWSARGCLRMKNNKVLPVLRRYNELMENQKDLNHGEITIESSNLKISLKTDFLVE